MFECGAGRLWPVHMRHRTKWFDDDGEAQLLCSVNDRTILLARPSVAGVAGQRQRLAFEQLIDPINLGPRAPSHCRD
jgi:hypothetical protein